MRRITSPFPRTPLMVVAAALTVLAFIPDTALQAQKKDTQPELPAELAQVRAALDKYRDPIAAVYDGYFSSLGCIDYPEGGGEGQMQYKAGGMGVHFLNLGNVGPTLDPAKPQVLIYEPDGDKLRLVAAEWFVPTQVAGATKPSIFGRELDGPMAGHAPIMPEGLHHYDLHVWLWKENASGVFHPTNPSVKCPKATYTFKEKAPKMVHAGH